MMLVPSRSWLLAVPRSSHPCRRWRRLPRHRATRPSRRGAGDAGRRQARLHRCRFRAFRAQDRLRHAGPGAELHHPHRRQSQRGLGQASENVLINGERIANKSGGAVDQLQRTPAANVERIEIVDAASLGIAGLSGQVANVILKAGDEIVRPVRVEPELPRPLRKARILRRARSAIRARPGRSNIPCRSRTSPAAADSAGRSGFTTATAS